jgi:hypothetical protein
VHGLIKLLFWLLHVIGSDVREFFLGIRPKACSIYFERTFGRVLTIERAPRRRFFNHTSAANRCSGTYFLMGSFFLKVKYKVVASANDTHAKGRCFKVKNTLHRL